MNHWSVVRINLKVDGFKTGLMTQRLVLINGQEFGCISCEISVEKAAYLDPVKCFI